MSKQSKRILIVEDEPDIREALVDKFSREGFDTSEAKNGEEGLARALKEHPDLVLLDIVMPKMDGVVVMKKLREDEWGESVPIILLTNVGATKEEIVRGMVESKPVFYLIKSDWNIDEVVEKVRGELEME